MSKIRLHGSSSGYTEIAPVAASGNNTLTLPNDGTIISKDANGAVGVTSVRATNAHFSGTTRVTTGITTTSQVTGDLQFNSGYGSVATAYGVRAWVNFNGTNMGLSGAGNVSSVSDNGVGIYKVNFTTNLPDENYSITGWADNWETNNADSYGLVAGHSNDCIAVDGVDIVTTRMRFDTATPVKKDFPHTCVNCIR